MPLGQAANELLSILVAFKSPMVLSKPETVSKQAWTMKPKRFTSCCAPFEPSAAQATRRKRLAEHLWQDLVIRRINLDFFLPAVGANNRHLNHHLAVMRIHLDFLDVSGGGRCRTLNGGNQLAGW